MNSSLIDNYNVAAIIVTYRPDLIRLKKLTDSITNQVSHCLIVDNTPEQAAAKNIEAKYSASNLKYRWMKSNLGLAEAQNQGIIWAEDLNMDHVLLLDQDSVPSMTMVEEQLNILTILKNSGKSISAIGPLILHEKTHKPMPFIKINNFHLSRKYYEKENIQQAYESVTFMAASGSLIPMKTIQDIGYMDSSLFIDHIDTEWFLRAENSGYSCYVACNAQLFHKLGENTFRIWIGKWRHLSTHKPFRYYYMYRNSIYLYRKYYKSWRWVIFDLRRSIQVFVMCILMQSRAQNLKMIFYGISDGIRKKTGKATKI